MSFFRSIDLFRVRGIPVRVHPSLLIFLVIAGLLFSSGGGLAGILATILFLGMIFGFVLLHEMGHALVAQRLGVPVRSITLHPLGGVASLAMMPREPRHELLITAAGPAVNFVLAAVFAAMYVIAPVPVALLKAGIVVNLALGLFNLLPAFPLDGGRVLRALLAIRLSYVDATRIAARIGQVVAVIMGVAGLLMAHPILAMIGVFVFFAAGAELAAVEQGSPFADDVPMARRVVRRKSPGDAPGPSMRQVVMIYPPPPDNGTPWRR